MGIDDMKILEQKAQQLATEAEQDKAKPKEKILFVRSVPFPEAFLKTWIWFSPHEKTVMIVYRHRSDTSRSELAELSKQANPDEIDIDDVDEDDENQGPDGQWQTNQVWCLVSSFYSNVSSWSLQRCSWSRRWSLLLCSED